MFVAAIRWPPPCDARGAPSTLMLSSCSSSFTSYFKTIKEGQLFKTSDERKVHDTDQATPSTIAVPTVVENAHRGFGDANIRVKARVFLRLRRMCQALRIGSEFSESRNFQTSKGREVRPSCQQRGDRQCRTNNSSPTACLRQFSWRMGTRNAPSWSSSALSAATGFLAIGSSAVRCA